MSASSSSRLSSSYLLSVLFKMALFLLSLFFVQRIFFLACFSAIIKETSTYLIAKTAYTAAVFDLMLISRVALVLILLHFGLYLLKNNERLGCRIFQVAVVLIHGIIVFAAVIDIPYFLFFGSRLNALILQRNFTLSIVSGLVKAHTGYTALALVMTALSVVVLKRSPGVNANSRRSLIVVILLSVLFVFMGRGRLTLNKPPRNSQASRFSNSSVLNNISLNTLLHLFDRSSPWKRVPYDVDLVKKNAGKYLKAEINAEGILERKRVFRPAGATKKNVVLLIMESLLPEKMGIYGNPHNLTPNLDRYAKSGIWFKHMYTSGIHTYNGIFSTLYGIPTVYSLHPMMETTGYRNKYRGLPGILKEKGYHTMFFTNGEKEFDNLADFLASNGFDEIVSQVDYPPEKIINEYGVSDLTMFDSALHRIGKQRPFLAVFMTASSHAYLAVPEGEGFHPSSPELTDQRYEYADWALGKFINALERMDLYSETVFVVVSDHGRDLEGKSVLALSNFHMPLIIFGKSITGNQEHEEPGMQIDLFPTIMNILRLDYTDHSCGTDLFEERRKYAFFCSDDKIGCLDNSRYLVIADDIERMYSIVPGQPYRKILQDAKTSEDMKGYLYSMLDYAHYLMFRPAQDGFRKLSP